MSEQNNVIDRITLLGFCSGAIPIIAEVAFEALNCRKFDIVKNISVKDPDKPYMWSDFRFSMYDHYDYNFDQSKLNTFFGVNTPHIKYILYDFFFRKFGIDRSRFVNLIHPSAYFSRSSEKSYGLLLEPMSVVSSFSKIGFGVIIKRNCSIGHHVIIDDYASIHPGVNISSRVHIGEGVMLGTGSAVKDGVRIGKHSLIGIGSVVTKDIPDGVVAFGNPCKVIKQNEIWENVLERLASQM